MLCCSAIKFWKPKCKGFIRWSIMCICFIIWYSPLFSRLMIHRVPCSITVKCWHYYCQMLTLDALGRLQLKCKSKNHLIVWWVYKANPRIYRAQPIFCSVCDFLFYNCDLEDYIMLLTCVGCCENRRAPPVWRELSSEWWGLEERRDACAPCSQPTQVSVRAKFAAQSKEKLLDRALDWSSLNARNLDMYLSPEEKSHSHDRRWKTKKREAETNWRTEPAYVKLFKDILWEIYCSECNQIQIIVTICEKKI